MMIDSVTSGFREEINRIPPKSDGDLLKLRGLMNHLWAKRLLIRSLSDVSCSRTEPVVFMDSVWFADLLAVCALSPAPTPAAA